MFFKIYLHLNWSIHFRLIVLQYHPDFVWQSTTEPSFCYSACLISVLLHKHVQDKSIYAYISMRMLTWIYWFWNRIIEIAIDLMPFITLLYLKLINCSWFCRQSMPLKESRKSLWYWFSISNWKTEIQAGRVGISSTLSNSMPAMKKVIWCWHTFQ